VVAIRQPTLPLWFRPSSAAEQDRYEQTNFFLLLLFSYFFLTLLLNSRRRRVVDFAFNSFVKKKRYF
jgi:uncharacterized RDD family membrane protein YckC